MKIRASFSRKVGLPGFCSLGAGCEVETDCKSTDPGQVAAAIRAAQVLCVQAVEDQLAAQLELHTTEPEPDPQPELEPLPRRLPRENPRAGGPPLGSGKPPTDGRQLYAHLRRLEDQEGVELLPIVLRWAKRERLSDRVTTWGPDETRRALAYLDAQGDDDEAPAPRRPAAGRNGGGRATRAPF